VETRPCVGCGYCCKKAVCVGGLAHGSSNESCDFLIFKDGRYWCRLALELMESGDEDERAKVLFDLGIGVGCCSPLNSERRKYGG
jgi:hypothetical protein